MDWLEEELTQALARKEPSAGFDARVKRGESAPAQSDPDARAAVGCGSGGGRTRRRERRAIGWHRGQVAKEQVMTAMRIAGGKLNRVQMQLEGDKTMRPLRVAALGAAAWRPCYGRSNSNSIWTTWQPRPATPSTCR